MTAKKMADIFFGKFSELIESKEISREKYSKPERENITNKKMDTKYSNKVLIYSVGTAILLGIIVFLIL
jgi:hypothetical protein